MTRYNAIFILPLVVGLGLIFGCGGASNATKTSDPATNVNADKPASTPAPASTANTDKAETPRNTATSPADSKSAAETRCGWFENPTPSNAWLIDRDGEWIIAVQGGYQAEGDWPDFSDDQWVKTNVNYGYGCACMSVTVDKAKHRVVKIMSATPKALSVCRNDKAIKDKEPKDN